MKYTTEQETRLRELVAEIRIHQRNESDSKFCQRYRKFIGTPDMWRRRLLAGEFEEVGVPRRIELLTRLITFLASGNFPEDFYDDLPFFVAFKSGLAQLEAQTATDRRIFAVLGAVGVGKTAACQAVCREALPTDYEGPRRQMIIISEALRENKIGLLTTIAAALKCVPEQSGGAALMEAIRSQLSGPDFTLIFDEAHQGGVMLMRIIKDLVNVTVRTKFVYVALRTEWARVISSSKGAIVEAKQFIRRCRQPVFDSYAGGTKAALELRDKTIDGDAAVFLRRKAGLSAAEARRLAVEKIEALRAHGNLSTLADAVDLALEKAESDGADLFDQVQASIHSICGA